VYEPDTIDLARSVDPDSDVVHAGTPDFELPDQDGRAVKLSDLRGQNVVLYFYPKADTWSSIDNSPLAGPSVHYLAPDLKLSSALPDDVLQKFCQSFFAPFGKRVEKR
jgi:hypothetical protein